MASIVMNSLSLKPSGLKVAAPARGLPSLARPTSFKVQASGVKKIKTDTPYGNFQILVHSYWLIPLTLTIMDNCMHINRSIIISHLLVTVFGKKFGVRSITLSSDLLSCFSPNNICTCILLVSVICLVICVYVGWV